MNKKLILTTIILGIFIFNQIVWAQENSKVKGELTIPDRDIYRLLGVQNISLLPTSPFYFVKEWWRGVRMFFTFNPVKKAELELQFSDEKLTEAKKVVDENCKDSQEAVCKQEVLEKAFNNYFESQEKLVKRLEGLENNPNAQNLASKVMEKTILHQVVLDELSARAITPSGKVIVKNIQKNRRLASNDEKHIVAGVEAALSKLPYEEGIRELKALEVLTRIEENLPEEAKKGIETAKENIEKRLIEEGKLKQLLGKNITKGTKEGIVVESEHSGEKVTSQDGIVIESEASGEFVTYQISGVPFNGEPLQEVINNLQAKVEATEGKGIRSKPFITSDSLRQSKPDEEGDLIEVIQELKTKLKDVKPVEVPPVVPKLIGPVCPTIAPDTSKGLEECLKAAKVLEEKYPGCEYSSICRKSENINNCGPIPLYPTKEGCERVCKDGKWQDICKQEVENKSNESLTCGKIQCLRYDPVCGSDGKTYGCGEAEAKACGVDVAYPGECKTSSLTPPPEKQTFCTQEWNPVCGTDGRTYSNECMAKARGVEVKYQGECNSLKIER